MDKIAEQVKAVQRAFNAGDPVPGPSQSPSAYSAWSAVGACPLVLGPVDESLATKPEYAVHADEANTVRIGTAKYADHADGGRWTRLPSR